MKKSNEQPLHEVIHSMIHKFGIADKVKETMLTTIWDEVAGKMIANKTNSIQVRNNIIIVKITSAPLRQELQFIRHQLLEKINERVPFGKLDDIEIR